MDPRDLRERLSHRHARQGYVPTVTINGATVYNNSGATLTHYGNTRWDVEGWIGGDPQITPKHNSAQLIATTPWCRTIGSAILASRAQRPRAGVHPMAHGAWTLTQGDTGFRMKSEYWRCGCALLHQRRPQGLSSGHRRCAGARHYAIVWRNSADNLPVRPSALPSGR